MERGPLEASIPESGIGRDDWETCPRKSSVNRDLCLGKRAAQLSWLLYKVGRMQATKGCILSWEGGPITEGCLPGEWRRKCMRAGPQ